MDEHLINRYLHMLKISKEFAKDSLQRYNQDNKKFQEEYVTSEYHIFAFTQLIYAIHEALEKDYPKAGEKIKKTFENEDTALGLMYATANSLRHMNGRIGAHQKITIKLKQNLDAVSDVDVGPEDKFIVDETRRINGRVLGKSMDEAYSQTITFVKTLRDERLSGM